MILREQIRLSFINLKYLVVEDERECVSQEISAYIFRDCNMIKFTLLSDILRACKSLGRLSLDLTIHFNSFADSFKKKAAKQLVSLVMTMSQLNSIHLTPKFTATLQGCSQIFYLRILTKESLYSIYIDGMICYDESGDKMILDPLNENKRSVGFSSNL